MECVLCNVYNPTYFDLFCFNDIKQSAKKEIMRKEFTVYVTTN